MSIGSFDIEMPRTHLLGVLVVNVLHLCNSVQLSPNVSIPYGTEGHIHICPREPADASEYNTSMCSPITRISRHDYAA